MAEKYDEANEENEENEENDENDEMTGGDGVIKLIATDIDGTLIPEGTREMEPELLALVKTLRQRGILFAAASGRQQDGIEHLFREIRDDVIFISNNGARITCRGRKLFEAVMDPETVRRLVPYIRGRSDCLFTLSGSGGESYVEENAPREFVELLTKGYGSRVTVVPDVLCAETETIKIAMYRREGISEIAPEIHADWEGELRILETGKCWMDFVDYRADKGSALEYIQKLTGISREETMAFGDNLNDLGLFIHAAHSYAVGNARPEVKQAARHIADTMERGGVQQVLRALAEQEVCDVF